MLMIAYAVIAAGIFFTGFGTGWKVDNWRNAANTKAAIEAAQAAEAAERARAEEIAGRFETKLAKIAVVNKTFYNEVRHETEKAVYVDPNCNLPVSGVQLRNRAIEAANNPGGSPPALPSDPKDGGKTAVPGRTVPSGQRPDSAVR